MPLQTLTLFTAASLLLALAPGPDILTVIVRSVTQGLRAGLAATLGFASGLTVHTTLAAVGIAALLKTSPHAMAVIRLLGAAYLLYLAIHIFLSRQPLNLDAPRQNSPLRNGRGATSGPAKLRGVYAQSVLMNVLNPKVTLFFLSFLPGFIDPAPSAKPPAWLQSILLGLIFALCTIVIFGLAALSAATLSRFLRQSPRAAAALRYATAALFLALALWLLLA